MCFHGKHIYAYFLIEDYMRHQSIDCTYSVSYNFFPFFYSKMTVRLFLKTCRSNHSSNIIACVNDNMYRENERFQSYITENINQTRLGKLCNVERLCFWNDRNLEYLNMYRLRKFIRNCCGTRNLCFIVVYHLTISLLIM